MTYDQNAPGAGIGLLQFVECKIYHARLQIYEADALAILAYRPGIALARLWPGSAVIQVVTLDGVHIGRVRLTNPHEKPECWIAVPLAPGTRHGTYPSADAAARALVPVSSLIPHE